MDCRPKLIVAFLVSFVLCNGFSVVASELAENPKQESFFLGLRLDKLISRPIQMKRVLHGKEVFYTYRIKDAVAMSCFGADPGTGVLIRKNVCHVINAHPVSKEIANLPVLPGDKFFRFAGLAEIKALGITILTGREAVSALSTGSKE